MCSLRSRPVSPSNKENIGGDVACEFWSMNAVPFTAGTATVGIQTEEEFYASHADISAQYDELAKKHEVLRQQVKHYREAHGILSEKYRRNKAVWKQWVEVDKARRQKSEQLKAQMNTARGQPITPSKERAGAGAEPPTFVPELRPPNISPVLTSPVGIDKRWDSSPPTLHGAMSEHNEAPMVTTLQAGIDDPPLQSGAEPEQATHYDSDRTTDGEGEMRAAAFSPTARAIFSDGGRSVPLTLPANKQSAKIKAEKHTQCLNDSPVVIKSEPRSSNSVMDHIAFTQHSLDLDDIGRKPETPRKRNYMSNLNRQREARQREKQNNISPTALGKRLVGTPMFDGQAEDGDEEGENEEQFQRALRSPPFVIPMLPVPRLSGVKVSGILVDTQAGHPAMPSGPSRRRNQSKITGFFASDGDPGHSHNQDSATMELYPLVNTNRHGQLGASPMKKAGKTPRISSPRRTRKRDHKQLHSGIESMTEDGINDSRNSTSTHETVLKQPRNEVLGKLLNTPLAKAPSITHLQPTANSIVTPSHPSATLEEDHSSRLTTPSAGALAKRRSNPVTDPPVSKKTKLNTTSERKLRPMSPQAGGKDCLRSRVARDLCVTDFSINTEKTGGLNYAFQNVVRKRDERKCLPGCLRTCCAEVAKFLKGAGVPKERSNAPKWRSSPPVPQSDAEDEEEEEEEEDQGDGGEKGPRVEEIRDFTDRFGKHREMFDRRRSPPGFWDPDFPDTQEAEERRKIAREEDRRRVQEMKMEARRRGRYKFRDREGQCN